MNPGALAAKRATATNSIPVVMTNVGDAVGWGIVTSLARLGGRHHVAFVINMKTANAIGITPPSAVRACARIGKSNEDCHV